MANNERSILYLINESKETIITLTSYYDEFEPIIQNMSNVPQLPLPVFSGDPKL